MTAAPEPQRDPDMDVWMAVGLTVLDGPGIAPAGTRRRAQQIETRAVDAARFLGRVADIRAAQETRDQQNTNALRER